VRITRKKLGTIGAVSVAVLLITTVSMMLMHVPVAYAVRGSQITVNVGTTVRAYAHVNNPSSSDVSITLKMEIRRDIISGTDSVKATLTKTKSVPSGISFVDMGTFVADEQTYESGSGKLREYFMKVWINDVLVYDPTDPATREWVKTTSTAGSVTWESPGEWEA